MATWYHICCWNYIRDFRMLLKWSFILEGTVFKEKCFVNIH